MMRIGKTGDGGHASRLGLDGEHGGMGGLGLNVIQFPSHGNRWKNNNKEQLSAGAKKHDCQPRFGHTRRLGD
jgi:hypothetical protein